MGRNSIELRYTPSFFDDLESIVLYINDVLKNPDAASRLTDAVELAILKRVPNADSFEPYESKYERKNVYYRIYVNNFTIYYVIIDGEKSQMIMEVRRILYSKRDVDSAL